MSNTVGVHFNINKATQGLSIAPFTALSRGLINRGTLDFNNYYETFSDAETDRNNGEYYVNKVTFNRTDVFLKFIAGDENRINIY